MTVAVDDAFKNDALDRQPFGEALLNIVTRSKDELVVSIDGRWGEGKTTFVKMWRGLLKKHNIPSIYYRRLRQRLLRWFFRSVAKLPVNSNVSGHDGARNN